MLICGRLTCQVQCGDCFLMDTHVIVAGGLGLAIGWQVRGQLTSPPECAPCGCSCQCIIPSQETGGGWLGSGILGCLAVGLILLAANFVLAFKVTFSQKGRSSEVALQVKGKSKGLYNPSRPLQITD